MNHRVCRICGAAAVAMVLAVSLRVSARADAAPRIELPALGLAQAIQSVARQAGVNILVDPRLVAAREAPAVKGVASVGEALDLLLEGTGLTARYVDEKTIALLAVESTVRLDSEGRLGRNLQNCSGFSSDKRDSSTSYGCKSQNAQGNLALARVEGEEGVQPVQPNDAESNLDSDLTKSLKVEEVVVTAQRREQNLQDVPISISVLSGEALDRSTAEGLLDELERVAGLAVTPSSNIGSSISIRGVAPAFTSFFTSSPIGYYIDSVPFGMIKAAITPDLGAYDLERVEVLRGPHGTLYGASSQGGLVRIISRDANLVDPEFQARGSVSQTLYGGENYRGDMAMSVPIVEGRVGARIVAGYQDLSGWIDQPNTGHEDANDALIRTMRLKVNAQPTDALSLELSSWFSRGQAGAPSIGNDARQFLTSIDETQHSDFDLYSFEAGYEFDTFSLTSATSYMSFGFTSITDTFTTGASNLLNRQYADIFAQEIQLSSLSEGPWRWTAGALYRDVEERAIANRTNAAGAQVSPYVARIDATYFSESYAVFGEVTRSFFDGRFELTGGLRYFHDEISGREDSAQDGGPPAGESRTREFEKVSPRLVATWLPTEDLTAYVSYSEGFRSGADQAPVALAIDPALPEVQPDNLSNYEIGVKGILFGGRLNYEAAAYYMDWQDVQSSALVFTGGFAFAVSLNGPSASGPGFDLALSAEPIEGLTLGTSVSWNDLTFDGDVSSGIGTSYRRGDRLSGSPELTTGVWLDYLAPLSSGYDVRFGASANYTSERYVRLFGPASAAFVNDSLITGTVRLSLESSNNWSATLFADNITNEQEPITGLDPIGRTDTSLRFRPRTVGIQLQYRY